MADHTFEELKKKNAAELKEIAKGIEHEAVQGFTQLNKDHLLEAICKALNIEMHVHHDVKGVDKAVINNSTVYSGGVKNNRLTVTSTGIARLIPADVST